MTIAVTILAVCAAAAAVYFLSSLFPFPKDDGSWYDASPGGDR